MRGQSRLGSSHVSCVILLVLSYCVGINATFWTFTSCLQYSMSISTYKTFSYTITATQTIRSGLTPTVTPASTRTYEVEDDLTLVWAYYPPDTVPEEDIITTTESTTEEAYYTQFVEGTTYTAPASCPTPFTVATYFDVYVPAWIRPQLNATSTATSVVTGVYTTPLTYLTKFVDPTAVPSTTVTDNYVYTRYIANCINPASTRTTYPGATATSASGTSSGGSFSGGDDDDDDLRVCGVLTGCTTYRNWVIAVATVLPTIFLLGWLESWLWFRQLMLGKFALRLGTVCWCLVSLWAICLTRSSPSRSKEDQAALRAQWNGMEASTRFKLWFKWGFRHQYPEALLGPDPRKNPPAQQAPFVVQQQNGQGPPPGGDGPTLQGQPPFFNEKASLAQPTSEVQQFQSQPQQFQGHPQQFQGQPQQFQGPPQQFQGQPQQFQGQPQQFQGQPQQFQGQPQQAYNNVAPSHPGQAVYVPSPSPLSTDRTYTPQSQQSQPYFMQSQSPYGPLSSPSATPQPTQAPYGAPGTTWHQPPQ